jgi:hypothetical protein
MSNDAKLAKLQKLRKISDLWDRSLSVPGTNFKVGLESLVGLLPVGGDVIGILLSVYILFQAIQFRLPPSILFRMLFNILLDGVVGSVPIVGDIFDTTWKANTKNVNLLEAHIREPIKSQKTNKWFLLAFFGAIALVVVSLISISILLVWLVWRYLHN